MTSPDISPQSRWNIRMARLAGNCIKGLFVLQLGGVVEELLPDGAEESEVAVMVSPPVETDIIPITLPPVPPQPIRSTVIPPSTGILPPEITQPICEASSIQWLPETVARWHPYVAETARYFNLPPAILNILMTFESLGHPTIVSHAEAVGLIQILPSTGEYLSNQLGLPPLDLTDPASNTFLSGQYISNLVNNGQIDMSRGFDAEVVRQIAIAYNAGGGRLQTYLNGGGYESLPDETKFYSDHVVWAWNEQGAEQSAAVQDYLSYSGAQDLLNRAATVGVQPCEQLVRLDPSSL